MLDREKNGCAPAHGVTTNCESMQAEYVGDLVDELHHALLGIVAVGHGSGQPVPRQVDRDDAKFITKPFCPRLPGIERGIGTMNEDERKRVARATVPDMGTRSVRQHHELRWRAGVPRFEVWARDSGWLKYQNTPGRRRRKPPPMRNFPMALHHIGPSRHRLERLFFRSMSGSAALWVLVADPSHGTHSTI